MYKLWTYICAFKYKNHWIQPKPIIMLYFGIVLYCKCSCSGDYDIIIFKFQWGGGTPQTLSEGGGGGGGESQCPPYETLTFIYKILNRRTYLHFPPTGKNPVQNPKSVQCTQTNLYSRLFLLVGGGGATAPKGRCCCCGVCCCEGEGWGWGGREAGFWGAGVAPCGWVGRWVG